MSDDKKIKGPEDQKRINIHAPWEIAYWTKALGITPEELVRIVGIVGTYADDVRAYLSRHKKR